MTTLWNVIACITGGAGFLILLDFACMWCHERRDSRYWRVAIKLVSDDQLKQMIAEAPEKRRCVLLYRIDYRHRWAWDEYFHRGSVELDKVMDKVLAENQRHST